MNSDGYTYRTPAWLHARVNDPYGTPNRHPFWETQEAERVNDWKLFERDGIWFGYGMRYNAWAHFATEDEARSHAAGPSIDVWA